MDYTVLIWTIVFFLAGYFLCLIFLKKIIRLAAQGGSLALNFQGQQISFGTGVIFSLVMLILGLAGLLLMPEEGIDYQRILLLLLGLIGFSFLGLIDDMWGNREVTGLRGHGESLRSGHLTTGILKAVFGLILAFCLTALENDWPYMILYAFILALSANSFNLFDLRPGRACKYFYLTFIVTLILGLTSVAVISYETAFLTGLAGIVLAYLPFDLRARTMMGDAGSNALGLVLGLMVIWTCNFQVQIIYLAYLLLLHALTERVSLTNLIAKVPPLNFLDQLGRKDRVKRAKRTKDEAPEAKPRSRRKRAEEN